ncbi:hypothetical protein NB311A_19866 [Nitrobacter sp. Nb-311A]|nr:hypothetical protein NB311A_19866 [Nitrobacter sp. Nb-311A]
MPLITRRSSTLATPCDKGKYGFDPAHLRLGEQKQIGHRGVSQKRQ